MFQNPDDARVFVERRLVRAERVVLVPGSGVRTDQLDPKRFDPAQRERLRAELGVAPADVMVTMVTRVIRSKGVLDLLAVARALRTTHPRARFLLVGAHEPESMDQLEDAELRALESELIWVGQRNDVPALLAASDAMAFPSGYGEGIPRVLLEAAAMALPIVTTDAPGCREVVSGPERLPRPDRRRPGARGGGDAAGRGRRAAQPFRRRGARAHGGALRPRGGVREDAELYRELLKSSAGKLLGRSA